MKNDNRVLIIGGCGYIGSGLFKYLRDQSFHVDTVDLEWFGNEINPDNIKLDYAKIKKSFLDSYNVVILLAGHSTVKMCEEDVKGSYKNNVEKFIDLVGKLSHQKFIYASTYRLYGNTKIKEAAEAISLPMQKTVYDITKAVIDNYISLTDVKYYGLRMATVNGFSPNLRINQIINNTFYKAKTKKKINIYNPTARFSILGINDLCRVIRKIIEGEDNRGIYNIASCDITVKNIGTEIKKMISSADILISKNDKKAYNITVDTSKFKKVFKFKFKENPRKIIQSLLRNFSSNTHVLNTNS